MKMPRLSTVLFYILALLVALPFLFPLVWIALASFKTQAQIVAVPPVWIFEPTLENYQKVFLEQEFGRFRFAWAGPLAPGQGHYFRVHGPATLIEHDNTQNNANHIHSVWRDLSVDFGNDALADHYRRNQHR